MIFISICNAIVRLLVMYLSLLQAKIVIYIAGTKKDTPKRVCKKAGICD